MEKLADILRRADRNGIAVGHFNISDLIGLKAVFESARELNSPVIIGTSEGERKFIGEYQAAALIKSLRYEYGFPIFLNADHTHSFEGVRKAVEAGYDAVLFDASRLGFEENIKETKQVVEYVKSVNEDILVEGELGRIGSSSKVYDSLPKGVDVSAESLTSCEDAAYFVRETGVDLLAPAVGNVHGIIKGGNPKIDISRILEIKKAVGGTLLVLHGGSGIQDGDLENAVKAGINIVHISTELRVALRKGLENGLEDNPDEVAPYRIYAKAVELVKSVVSDKIKIFKLER